METFEDHYASLHKALLKYMPSADMDLIDRAVEYANAKHQYQKRKDGSPRSSIRAIANALACVTRSRISAELSVGAEFDERSS